MTDEERPRDCTPGPVEDPDHRFQLLESIVLTLCGVVLASLPVLLWISWSIRVYLLLLLSGTVSITIILLITMGPVKMARWVASELLYFGWRAWRLVPRRLRRG